MPSFLSVVLRASSASAWSLMNARTGGTVAEHLVPAVDSKSRRIGLLRHEWLPEDEALVLAPTSAIHTFFMKFEIDVAFLAKDGTVLKIKPHLGPGKVAARLGAFAVVELAGGILERARVRVGDRLEIAAAGPSEKS
jgi:uncharacterized protein